MAEKDKTFFERMGVYGLNKKQDIIFASVLSGSPILFIGSAGSAKTKLIEQLGKALQMKTAIYNCSCVNYEDLVGYCLPNKEGTEMDIIKAPYGIHDVEVLGLDEISRCRIDRQNDLLSIINERRVHNIYLDKLKFIFGAMNPIQDVEEDSYEGSQPLDKAFAERFAWTVVFPHFMEMSNPDRKSIVGNTNLKVLNTLSFWNEKDNEKQNSNLEPDNKDEQLSNDIKQMLRQASENFNFINENYGKSISDYVLAFTDALYDKGKKPTSGRTADMIYNNIVSLAAVRRATYPKGNLNLVDVAYDTVMHSFSDISVGDGIKETKIESAHNLAKSLLSEIIQEIQLADLKRIKNPVERVRKAFNAKIDSQNFSTLIFDALKELKEKDPLMAFLFSVAIFYQLKDKNVVINTVMVDLAKEVKKIGQRYDLSSSDNDRVKEIDKQLNTSFKEKLSEAQTNQEVMLLKYTALIYRQVYARIEDKDTKKVKDFDEVYSEFLKILKNFKNASEELQITN